MKDNRICINYSCNIRKLCHKGRESISKYDVVHYFKKRKNGTCKDYEPKQNN